VKVVGHSDYLFNINQLPVRLLGTANADAACQGKPSSAKASLLIKTEIFAKFRFF
jgi:hypothetical protein